MIILCKQIRQRAVLPAEQYFLICLVSADFRRRKFFMTLFGVLSFSARRRRCQTLHFDPKTKSNSFLMQFRPKKIIGKFMYNVMYL